MHRPDFSSEAKFQRAANGDGTFVSANEGDGSWIKEAGEDVCDSS
jgi:hypothetical protein